MKVNPIAVDVGYSQQASSKEERTRAVTYTGTSAVHYTGRAALPVIFMTRRTSALWSGERTDHKHYIPEANVT